MPIRVFILDDHEIVRRGLRELLERENDMEVVGEASNGKEATELVPLLGCDIAIIDIRLGDEDGIVVCRELLSQGQSLKCLILTSFADDEVLTAAVLAGASGYLLKQIHGFDLVTSIRQVHSGATLFDPSVIQQARDRLHSDVEISNRASTLTPQERVILNLIAEGKTNREIATEIYLAEKTVKNYVSTILSKMGFSRRTEAAVYITKMKDRSGGTA